MRVKLNIHPAAAGVLHVVGMRLKPGDLSTLGGFRATTRVLERAIKTNAGDPWRPYSDEERAQAKSRGIVLDPELRASVSVTRGHLNNLRRFLDSAAAGASVASADLLMHVDEAVREAEAALDGLEGQAPDDDAQAPDDAQE